MNRVTNFPRFLSGFYEIQGALLLDAYVGNSFQPAPGQRISLGDTGNPFDNIVSSKLFNENGLLQVNSLESSFVPLGIALDDGVATASLSIDDNSLVVVDNKLSVKSIVSIGQTGDVAFNAPLQLTVQESPTPSTVGLSIHDRYFLINGGGQLDLLPTTATDPISYDGTDLKIGLKYDKTLDIDENDGKLKVKSGLLKGVQAIKIKEDPLAWLPYDFGIDPNFASIELKTDGITLDQSTGVLKCNYQTIPPLNITGSELSLQVDDITLVAAGEFLRANYVTIPPLAITGNEISLQVDDLTLVAAGPLLKGNYLGMPPIYIGGNEISFHPITGPGIVYADDVLSLDLVGLEGVTIEGNVISCPIVGGEGVLVEFSPIGYVISAIPLLETKRPLLESDPVETAAPGAGPGLLSSQGAILGSGSLIPTIQTTGSANSVVSAITPDFVGFPFLGSGLPMAIPGTVLGGIASIIGNAAGTQTVTVFGYNPFHLIPERDSHGDVETEEGSVRPSAVTGGTPTVAIVTDNENGSSYLLNDPPVDFSPLTWGLTGFGNSLIPNFGMVVQSISDIGGTIFQPILDSTSDIVANSLTISSSPTDGDQVTNKTYVDSTISSAVADGISGLISAPLVLTNTDDSTSPGTGSLQVAGGAGIGGNLYVGGGIYKGTDPYVTESYLPGRYQSLHENLTLLSQTSQTLGCFLTSSDDSPMDYLMRTPSEARTMLGLGALATAASVNLATQVTGTLANSHLAYALSSGSLALTDTTDSTTSTTGSLVAAGGCGVAGSVYVGGNLNIAGTTVLTGAVTVPTPTSTTHPTTKAYVDATSYLTAGTGLTKTGSTLSVNAFLGSLSGFAISSAAQIPASISTTYSSGTAYPITLYAPSVTGNDVLVPIGISPSNTAYFGFQYNGALSASNYASVGVRSNIVVLDPFRVYSDHVSVLHTADSTTTSTGALQISGGLAVVKNVYVGGNMNVTGSVTVPTPSATTDAGRKDYIDGLTYLTAGTGLTKTSSTLSVDAAQTQITSVGTLTSLAVSGTTVLTGAVTVPTPSSSTDAARKDYVDGISYITAGTGLTKTSSTLSVNAAQTQITSVGTLTSLNVSGTTTHTGVCTVLTPSATTDAARKDYVDGISYITAGTGLTKTSSTLSVNAAQTQITSVGTLSGLAISGTAQIPAAISTTYSSGTAYPVTLYAPNVSSNNVLLPIGISSSNTAYFGFMYAASLNSQNYASVGVRSNIVSIDPFRVYSDKITILHTADSTTTSTGALQISGGCAVTKNLVVGGNVSSVGLNVGGATNLSLGKNVFAGTDSNLAAGPHVCYFTNTDLTYPVFQALHFAHDNVSMGYDFFYDNTNWRTATSTVGFQLYKHGGNFQIIRSTGTPSPGAAANGTAALSITGSDGSIAIPSTSTVTPNMSNLSSSTGGALNVTGDVFVGGQLVVGGTGYSYYGNYEAYSFTGMSNYSTTQSYSILNNYNFYQSPNGQVCVFSDERLKKNGRPVSDATRVVKSIKAKSFEWKCRPGETKHGFFAGDVAAFIPEAIHTTSGSGDIVERVKTVVAYGRRVIVIMPTGTVLEEGDVLSVIDCDEVHHEGVLVESVADDACVELLFREKPNTRQDLLIYGRHLSDVKVLDNSMLVPFLWQAVSDLLERVESLEGGSASGDLNYR